MSIFVCVCVILYIPVMLILQKLSLFYWAANGGLRAAANASVVCQIDDVLPWGLSTRLHPMAARVSQIKPCSQVSCVYLRLRVDTFLSPLTVSFGDGCEHFWPQRCTQSFNSTPIGHQGSVQRFIADILPVKNMRPKPVWIRKSVYRRSMFFISLPLCDILTVVHLTPCSQGLGWSSNVSSGLQITCCILM